MLGRGGGGGGGDDLFFPQMYTKNFGWMLWRWRFRWSVVGFEGRKRLHGRDLVNSMKWSSTRNMRCGRQGSNANIR